MGRPATGELLVHHGRALGTTAEVAVTAPARLLDAADLLREDLDAVDRLASRFREDSEISWLHRHAGRRVEVSRELFGILEVALEVARATDGAVDPTVGGALCRLGYDRDFAAVVEEPGGELPEPRPVPGWGCVELDPAASTVLLPAGVRLDLGASAKAWAADRSAARIGRVLACGVLVALGGDVAVAGDCPPGGFSVALADRCEEDPGACPETVGISSGGLATSGTTKRRWVRDGLVVHHIVDPATGLPAETPWRTVSVIASSCLAANAAATAALVKGEEGRRWLETLGLPARLVGHDGASCPTAPWPDRGPAASRSHAR